MEITKISPFNGAIKLETTEGYYFIDTRLNTDTKNKIYIGYPMYGDIDKVCNLNQEDIKLKLLEALLRYDEKKQPSILEHTYTNFKKMIIEILSIKAKTPQVANS